MVNQFERGEIFAFVVYVSKSEATIEEAVKLYLDGTKKHRGKSKSSDSLGVKYEVLPDNLNESHMFLNFLNSGQPSETALRMAREYCEGATVVRLNIAKTDVLKARKDVV